MFIIKRRCRIQTDQRVPSELVKAFFLHVLVTFGTKPVETWLLLLEQALVRTRSPSLLPVRAELYWKSWLQTWSSKSEQS